MAFCDLAIDISLQYLKQCLSLKKGNAFVPQKGKIVSLSNLQHYNPLLFSFLKNKEYPTTDILFQRLELLKCIDCQIVGISNCSFFAADDFRLESSLAPYLAWLSY